MRRRQAQRRRGQELLGCVGKEDTGVEAVGTRRWACQRQQQEERGGGEEEKNEEVTRRKRARGVQ